MVFGRPLKRTLLNPTSGSFKRHLIERVYVPKHPPNPNSFRIGERVVGFCLTVLMRVDYRVSNRLAADWFCNWSFAVCVYIYMCKYTYIHTYIYIYTYVQMYVCMYICMYVYVRLRAFMCFCIDSPEGQMVLGFCIPQVGQHGLDAGF